MVGHCQFTLNGVIKHDKMAIRKKSTYHDLHQVAIVIFASNQGLFPRNLRSSASCAASCAAKASLEQNASCSAELQAPRCLRRPRGRRGGEPRGKLGKKPWVFMWWFMVSKWVINSQCWFMMFLGDYVDDVWLYDDEVGLMVMFIEFKQTDGVLCMVSWVIMTHSTYLMVSTRRSCMNGGRIAERNYHTIYVDIRRDLGRFCKFWADNQMALTESRDKAIVSVQPALYRQRGSSASEKLKHEGIHGCWSNKIQIVKPFDGPL